MGQNRQLPRGGFPHKNDGHAGRTLLDVKTSSGGQPQKDYRASFGGWVLSRKQLIGIMGCFKIGTF